MSGKKGRKIGEKQKRSGRPRKINGNTSTVANNHVMKRRKIHCSGILECNEEMKVNWDSRCSPAHFVYTVMNYILPNAAKVETIKEVGFGSLLDIRCITLQKPICKWISINFDCVNNCLPVGKTEKKTINFVEEDVERILGIPRGEAVVKLKGDEADITSLLEDFGLQRTEDDGITASWDHVLDYVIGDYADDTFIRAFIIYSFAVLLNPKARRTAKFNLLHSLTDLTKVKQMNWCRFVYQSTVDGIRSYQKSSKCGNQKPRYIQGCMYLMMIWYVEKTVMEGICVAKRVPLCSSWTEDAVADRITEEVRANKNFGLVHANPLYETCSDSDRGEDSNDIIDISSEDACDEDVNVAAGCHDGCNLEDNVARNPPLSLDANLEKINSYVEQIENHRALVDFHQGEIRRITEALKHELSLLNNKHHNSMGGVGNRGYCGPPNTQTEPNTIPESGGTSEGVVDSSLGRDVYVARNQHAPTSNSSMDIEKEDRQRGPEVENVLTDEARLKQPTTTSLLGEDGENFGAFNSHEEVHLANVNGNSDFFEADNGAETINNEAANTNRGVDHVNIEGSSSIYHGPVGEGNGSIWQDISVDNNGDVLDSCEPHNDQMDTSPSNEVRGTSCSPTEQAELSPVDDVRAGSSFIDQSQWQMVVYDGAVAVLGFSADVHEGNCSNVHAIGNKSCNGKVRKTVGGIENHLAKKNAGDEQAADFYNDDNEETGILRQRKNISSSKSSTPESIDVMPAINTTALIPSALMKHSIMVLTDCISDEEAVVCDMFGIKLEKEDLMSLMPHNWVNSIVVHTVVNLLNNVAEKFMPKCLRIYFDPGTTASIVETNIFGKTSEELSKFCNHIVSLFDRTKLASAEMFFFPVVHHKHWFVLIVNLRDERIEVLDCVCSKRMNPLHGRLVRNLRGRMSHLLTHVNNKKAFLVKHLKAERMEVPKSDTGHDCGLWAIAYMHLWDGCIVLPLDPDCVPQYRQYYVATILQSEANTLRALFLPNNC